MLFRMMLAAAFWLLFIIALLSPFTHLSPLKQADSLEDWQKPVLLSSLAREDQQKVLERLAYTQPLPPFLPLPDFNQFTDVAEKKRAFFQYLRPYIQRENSRLLSLRHQLTTIKEKQQKNLLLAVDEQVFIYSLFNEFRLEVEEYDDNSLNELLKRIDILPEMLVLMQAANESAWGTSRFAVEGFNFFGQWCFREGCGMVPNNRNEGQYHEVARFKGPAASIQSYFYNLNTFYTYETLRDIRAQLRRQNKPIRSEALAAGLERYSERGDEYIAEIRGMIRFNRKLLEE